MAVFLTQEGGKRLFLSLFWVTTSKEGHNPSKQQETKGFIENRWFGFCAFWRRLFSGKNDDIAPDVPTPSKSLQQLQEELLQSPTPTLPDSTYHYASKAFFRSESDTPID